MQLYHKSRSTLRMMIVDACLSYPRACEVPEKADKVQLLSQSNHDIGVPNANASTLADHGYDHRGDARSAFRDLLAKCQHSCLNPQRFQEHIGLKH